MGSMLDRFLYRMAKAMLAVVKPRIPSKTLRDAIDVKAVTQSSVALSVPHYWAVYYHAGRGSVSPVRGTWLVWYADPKDDPRLAGGYPVKLADVKRLTAAQFREGQRRNREAYLANPGGGLQQFMIAVEYSGPTRPSKKHPFFDDNEPEMVAAAEREAAAIVQETWERIAISETKKAKFRL